MNRSDQLCLCTSMYFTDDDCVLVNILFLVLLVSHNQLAFACSSWWGHNSSNPLIH